MECSFSKAKKIAKAVGVAALAVGAVVVAAKIAKKNKKK